jgi:hypothetical protein
MLLGPALSACSQGDYLQWRDEAFADESVDSLYKQVEAFQQDPASIAPR